MSTLEQIAQHVGVSVSTVSRVVRGHHDVNDATRQQVLRAIDRLGYVSAPGRRRRGRPAKAARGAMVGVVCREHARIRSEPFFAPILAGVLNALDRLGLRAAAVDWSDDRAVAAELDTVDGAILICVSEAHVRKLAPMKPCVTLDVYFPGSGADGVVTDYRQGAFEATRVLLERGHRRIALISAQRGPGEDFFAQVYDGARRALDLHGVEPGEDFLAAHTYRPDEGYTIAQRLLGRPNHIRPTAILGNDQAMMGALRAAADAGLRIPQDLACVGIDDIEMARYSVPRLSSASVDKDAMARMAVERLQWRLAHPDAPVGRLVSDCRFVERDSC